MDAKILLVGPGELGGAALDLLAREPCVAGIVVAGRSTPRGEARCNLARMIAATQGLRPAIRFVPADLDDGERFAALVRRERPDIVFTAATRQTWWLPDLLPPGAAAVLGGARFGAWLPAHLAPTLALMRALRDAEFRGIVLTAPYPDVVNCVLGRLGLAPTCGVGNVDEMATKVASLAAARLKVEPDRVRVTLVAHHALEPLVFADAGRGEEGARRGVSPDPARLPPFHLRVRSGDDDVTAAVGADALLLSPCPLPPGRPWCRLTAASVVRLVRALCRDGPTHLHAPGPDGLPGGYPIVAGGGEVRLAPIEGLTREEAILLNERSHRFDGIESIEADGTVVFRDEDAEALRAALGYSCHRLPPAEVESRAVELVDRFGAFARRHGLDIRSGEVRG